MTDQRLWIPASSIYTYPDIMVIAKPIALQPGRKDTVTNPILIAEVLSDFTKDYDRHEKFAAYRTIPEFQEYLLIDQYKPGIVHYVKQGENQWLFSEYGNLADGFKLSALSLEITLTDLYEDVEF